MAEQKSHNVLNKKLSARRVVRHRRIIMLRAKCSMSIVWLLINWWTFNVCQATLFERCDLVHAFKSVQPAIAYRELNTWICIAARRSQFNASHLSSDAADVQYHGIFQISDAFWCSRTGNEQRLCEIMCDRLHDINIRDDIECVRRIYAEHLRINGNGFSAWPMDDKCTDAPDMVSDCLNDIATNNVDEQSNISLVEAAAFHSNVEKAKTIPNHGRIFTECELAKELRYSHNIPIEQLHVWVCIAKYLTKLNTSYVASDAHGSRSFGLFQINDIYWCSHIDAAKGCTINCANLRDHYIGDDVACAKHIYDAHQRISGNGFDAWSAYEAECKHGSDTTVRECFRNELSNEVYTKPLSYLERRAKIYERCELARELRFQHNISLKQIPTWVCIAQYQSNLVTSAVQASDHGIFQINDRYWCGIGKSCGVLCSALEDTDITDDVKCAKQIYKQHELLYGDGFTAWPAYELYCKYQTHFTSDCFDASANVIDTIDQTTFNTAIGHSTHQSTAIEKGNGKVYNRCELAKKLLALGVPKKQLGTWVCIAKHESRFDTSAVGHLNADGSGDHGIFQISDLFWCSVTNHNDKACGVPCSKFEDSDITDDVECIKKIHAEHQRLFGNGFQAWAVYEPHCKHTTFQYVSDCFAGRDIGSTVHNVSSTMTASTATEKAAYEIQSNQIIDNGRAYERCELAKELRYIHNFPMHEIADWVCIALYASNLATSAKGIREYGLFQISNDFWCTNDGSNGRRCNIECTKLLDSDITDDIACVRTIFNEHSRFESGFNAWTVYEPFCHGRSSQVIDGCFDDISIKADEPTNTKVVADNAVDTSFLYKHGQRKHTRAGKIYSRCELAKELRYVYNMDHVHTWVCIAQRESNFDTAAVGRLNADGSGDHGIFQISDKYWCSSLQRDGKACGVECSKFEDSDISDDVKCIKKIYEEHQQLFGYGFQAWTTYEPYCRSITSAYVDDCFVGEASVDVIEDFVDIEEQQLGGKESKLPMNQSNEMSNKSCVDPIKLNVDRQNVTMDLMAVNAPNLNHKIDGRLNTTMDIKTQIGSILLNEMSDLSSQPLEQQLNLAHQPKIPEQQPLISVHHEVDKLVPDKPQTTSKPIDEESEMTTIAQYIATPPMKATIVSPTAKSNTLVTDASSFVSVTAKPTPTPIIRGVSSTAGTTSTTAVPKTTTFNIFDMYLNNYKTNPPKRHEFPELFASQVNLDPSSATATTTRTKKATSEMYQQFLSHQFTKLAPFIVPNSSMLLFNQPKQPSA